MRVDEGFGRVGFGRSGHDGFGLAGRVCRVEGSVVDGGFIPLYVKRFYRGNRLLLTKFRMFGWG